MNSLVLNGKDAIASMLPAVTARLVICDPASIRKGRNWSRTVHHVWEATPVANSSRVVSGTNVLGKQMQSADKGLTVSSPFVRLAEAPYLDGPEGLCGLIAKVHGPDVVRRRQLLEKPEV